MRLIITEVVLGPAAATQFGMVLEVLESAGFRDDRLEASAIAFYYYVLGAALAESAWDRGASTTSSLTAERPNRRSPATAHARRAAAFLSRHADTDARERFRRGLTAVLDGLQPR
ncbi:TetR/AcrR family transcriptional regulator C-terminal domain-containing protein [Nocardia sp. NPDC057030]|uniref:TetR/AcrR family transcriptional regulator C-terminal domain-containing protein n=1 Tax=unclassified Nocardia TaxID=2637762 RepID=UPI0036349707